MTDGRFLRNLSESSRLREEHDERLESLHKEVKEKVRPDRANRRWRVELRG